MCDRVYSLQFTAEHGSVDGGVCICADGKLRVRRQVRSILARRGFTLRHCIERDNRQRTGLRKDETLLSLLTGGGQRSRDYVVSVLTDHQRTGLP